MTTTRQESIDQLARRGLAEHERLQLEHRRRVRAIDRRYFWSVVLVIVVAALALLV